MSIIDKILRREGVTKQPRFSYAMGNWAIPPGWTLERYLKAYGHIGWLFGCISRIASAVADAQWHLYQVGKERKELDKHPLLDMLNYVNPFQTGQELFELSQMYLDLTGECFWVLNTNRMGQPAEIWIAPPERMQVVPSKKDFIDGYVYQFGGERVPFNVKEVIHYKYPNPANPYRGIGPAQSIAIDLDTELYSGQWNRNFFFNSADPGTVLKYPGTLSEGEFERVKEQWNQQHRGIAQAHKTAILQEGGQVDKTMMSQRDMDFWRLRKLNRDIILGAFGMPYAILGGSEAINRANAEAANYVFAKWVVKPRLTRFREKMNEQLCPLFGSNLEFGFDDPVPENREMIISEAERGVKAGFLTINEARQMLGFDAVRTGDVFIMPMTVVPTPAKEASQISLKASEKVLLLSAKSIFVTEEQKAAHWKAYAAKTEAEEKVLIKILNNLFGEQESEVLKNLDSAKKPEDALFDQDEADKASLKALKPALQEVLASAAEDADRLIEPEPAHRAVKQGDYPLSDDALVWLTDHSAWLVTGINQTTRDALMIQLVDGFAEGESIPKMAGRVRGVFDDCTQRRSLVIARTEVIAASNEGALAGYEGSGVVDKSEFYAALDERTCEECMALHGQVYALKDAHDQIPVHPNCRCVWLPVVE